MNQPSKMFHLRENPDFEWLKEVKPKKVDFVIEVNTEAFKKLSEEFFEHEKERRQKYNPSR